MIEKSILPPKWQVPQEFRARLGASVGRQRPMLADGHLLLVLHAPPKPEDHGRGGRFFWRSPDGTWTSKELGSGISALNKHLDENEDVIATLDRQEEEAKTAGDFATVATVFAIDFDIAVAKGYVPLLFLGAILCCLVTGGILTSFVYSPPPPRNERGQRKTADKVR